MISQQFKWNNILIVCVQIVGVDTNVDFLLDLCNHSEFISGNVHTNFIEHHRSELLVHKTPPDHIVIQVDFLSIPCILHTF